MSLSPDRHVFWLDNYKVLFGDGNYYKFIPTYDMTREEQLNAITRFFLYFSVVILISRRSFSWLYPPIIMIVLIAMLYKIHVIDDKGKEKELLRLLRQRKEKKEPKIRQYEKKYCDYRSDNAIDDVIYNITPDEEDKEFSVESGEYDADGNLLIDKKYDYPRCGDKIKKESPYTLEEMLEFKRETCRRPTKENPFMNPDIFDYANGDPPAGCNASDDAIKEEIVVNFNDNLYRDVTDLWEKKNSQRQFYTVPATTIPNNQKEFAEWLYKVPGTCKVDQERCLRYEDVRFKK